MKIYIVTERDIENLELKMRLKNTQDHPEIPLSKQEKDDLWRKYNYELQSWLYNIKTRSGLG